MDNRNLDVSLSERRVLTCLYTSICTYSSFHTILVTSFLFGEPDFSRLMNIRAIYYDK